MRAGGTAKQQHFRTLSLFPGVTAKNKRMESEFEELEESGDGHSVSEVLIGRDDDKATYKHCLIDCWLRATPESDPSALRSDTSSPQKSLNVTALGYVCLAPAETEVGDIAVILLGRSIALCCGLCIGGRILR